ncbi:unnamed protein product, partial [Polarella glacialis]
GTAVAAVVDDLAIFQCMDPLFRSHWYSGRTDTAQLEARPVTHERLLHCRMWNGRASCCNGALEVTQQAAFDAYRVHFEGQIAMMRNYLASLEMLRETEVYSHTEVQEKGLFDRAVDSFKPALDLADGCVTAIMTFVAGMICFSCEPQWSYYVWRSGTGDVLAVQVDRKACLFVDRSCGGFGRAVQNMYMRTSESKLAKMPSLPLPASSMLDDREQMCEWLRSHVAMQPLRPSFPSQAAVRSSRALAQGDTKNDLVSGQEESQDDDGKDAYPIPEAVVRATAMPPTVAPPAAPSRATEPSLVLDPVKDGLASGFELQQAA